MLVKLSSHLYFYLVTNFMELLIPLLIFFMVYRKSVVELAGGLKVEEGTVVEELVDERSIVKRIWVERSANEKTVVERPIVNDKELNDSSSVHTQTVHCFSFSAV